MPTLEEIGARLARHRAAKTPSEERPEFQAAVALVLLPGDSGAELLFIERAQREGDPWSGHMAFPGGRRDAGDAGLERTAARETLEEVGLELPPPLGSLDHFNGSRNVRVPPLLVAPFVYALSERPQLRENHEVNSTIWIPLRQILAEESWGDYEVERETESMRFPAFRYDGYTVWGLTYRILRNFFAVLGREIPSPD